MRIGIVGAGMVGHALAVRLAAAGHEVVLSNSRGAETLAGVVASIPGEVSAGTVAEAARCGELVAVAIPTQAIVSLPPEPFAGKLVLDVNNYYPEPDARLPELDADETTSSELLATLLPVPRSSRRSTQSTSSGCGTRAVRICRPRSVSRSRSQATNQGHADGGEADRPDRVRRGGRRHARREQTPATRLDGLHRVRRRTPQE